MKKYTGNFTPDASKVLKNSERVICRTTENGTIYICNGYFLYKMNQQEYAAIVQPVTCCEAGNWTIDKDGKRDEQKVDAAKVFADAVKAAENAGTLERCPLNLDTGKTLACCYYNATKDFAVFYNTKFISAFRSGATLRCPSPLSAAVAYDGEEPFAMVLPIKPEEKATRAVKAYFTDPCEGDKPSSLADELSAKLVTANNEIAQLREQIAQQAAELAAMRETQQTAEQTTAQDTQPAQDETPQTTSTEPKTAAELIAARFANMAGVTATIKGAQTTAPVVWLSGNTEKHADAIKAAGAKWSNKRSAFYVRVA